MIFPLRFQPGRQTGMIYQIEVLVTKGKKGRREKIVKPKSFFIRIWCPNSSKTNAIWFFPICMRFLLFHFCNMWAEWWISRTNRKIINKFSDYRTKKLLNLLVQNSKLCKHKFCLYCYGEKFYILFEFIFSEQY